MDFEHLLIARVQYCGYFDARGSEQKLLHTDQ